jgi:hypothetical protein
MSVPGLLQEMEESGVDHHGCSRMSSFRGVPLNVDRATDVSTVER